MDSYYSYLVLAIIAFPVCSFLIQAVLYWGRASTSERTTALLVSSAFAGSLAAAILAAVQFLIGDADYIGFTSGAAFSIGEHQFEWRFIADRLSLAFSVVFAILTGLVGAFSVRYLHREPGFKRFYLLLTLFGASVQLIALAGNIELVFFGWELVGISSALLIAFFQERLQPLFNGMRAYCTYRLCDIGFLIAIILYHQGIHDSAFIFTEESKWAVFRLPDPPGMSLVVVLGLLLAVMGKSALLPFSGWLPRAMEGPTPSSAIFYGAISVHLGPLLLMRAMPLIQQSALASVMVIAFGLLTACYATLVCRVQSDVKSMLAYASMTQVGLIVAEIGFGFTYLALAHCIGHAIFRTVAILQSPNAIQNFEHLERGIGKGLPETGKYFERIVPERARIWLYRFALERGFLDAVLEGAVISPLTKCFRALDSLERRWITFLAGTSTIPGDRQ